MDAVRFGLHCPDVISSLKINWLISSPLVELCAKETLEANRENWDDPVYLYGMTGTWLADLLDDWLSYRFTIFQTVFLLHQDSKTRGETVLVRLRGQTV